MSKKLNQETVITQFKEIHGDKYDYSLVEYKNARTKVKIICKEHGVFEKRSDAHIKGSGCSKCFYAKNAKSKIDSQLNIIKQFKEIHGDKYDYSLVNYVNSRTKLKIICNTHGVFEQTSSSHKKGSNCPKCSNENKSFTQLDIIKQFKEVHGDLYDYSLVKYVNAKIKVKIICKKHKVFEQLVSGHLQYKGCPKCGTEKSSKQKLISLPDVLKQFKEVHGDKYDYSLVKYINGTTKVKIICKEHGVFEQIPNSHKSAKGCLKCSNIQSKPEEEIVNFIFSLISDGNDCSIIRNDRNILNGNVKGKEIDIYLPDYKLGIEYNGLLWHSRGTTFPNNLDPNLKINHFNKTNSCDDLGINLLHIFENEWIDEDKKEKWKSVIRNKLHKNQNKVFGRKTSFKEITSKEANIFCEENHLQGKGVSGLNYGLTYKNKFNEDELISVMTFSKTRFRNKEHPDVLYEMIRFCNKKHYSINGGASKLLKNFRLLNPGGIVSYANRRWSDGHLYRTLGFTLSHISNPNYFYFHTKDKVNGVNKLWSRNKFQKHKLHNVLETFDAADTEFNNCFNNGYRQIFDSGNYVFILD